MNTYQAFLKLLYEKGYSDKNAITDIFLVLEQQVIEEFEYKVEFRNTDFVINKEFANILSDKKKKRLLDKANEYFIELASDLDINPLSFAVDRLS